MCSMRYGAYRMNSTTIYIVWIIKKNNYFAFSIDFEVDDFTEAKITISKCHRLIQFKRKILILPFILLVSQFVTVFLIWNNSFEMEYSNDKGRFQLMLKTHFEIHVEPFVCNNYFKKCSIFNSTGFNWFHLSWFWFNMGLNGDGRTRCPQIHKPPVHQ